MLKKFTWEEEDADAVQSFRRNDIINIIMDRSKEE